MTGSLQTTGADDADRWRRLARLYQSRRSDLVRLASMLCGSTVVAEDLVQEAYVRLHPRLDDVADPAAYLRTIVVNLCRDHHRRRSVASRLAAEPRPPEVDIDVPPDLTEVWLALRTLPERRRTALILRYYLDLDDKAIAEILNVRPVTVRSLVHRGLRQLREVLTP